MSLLLALIAIIFAGRLILKKYHPQSVLLLTGIVLLLIAHFSGMTSLSGLVKKSTGFGPFDAFEFIRDTRRPRAANYADWWFRHVHVSHWRKPGTGSGNISSLTTAELALSAAGTGTAIRPIPVAVYQQRHRIGSAVDGDALPIAYPSWL